MTDPTRDGLEAVKQEAYGDQSLGGALLDSLKMFAAMLFVLVVFAAIGAACYEATLYALHDTHVCHAGGRPR